MAKFFQFASEMQNTTLQIKDHRVISRATEQSFGNLIFEVFLPPFKISNIVSGSKEWSLSLRGRLGWRPLSFQTKLGRLGWKFSCRNVT
jgi:hypothetical protein